MKPQQTENMVRKVYKELNINQTHNHTPWNHGYEPRTYKIFQGVLGLPCIETLFVPPLITAYE